MSEIQLAPEFEQLIRDYASVEQRFTSLVQGYHQQNALLQKQQTELDNYAKQLSAMRQTEIENQRILKSYDQLKVDYERLYSMNGEHRKEIRAENNKRVHELEEEIKAMKARASEQASSHQIVINQIVSDYEAKLRNADAKIRQLNSSRDDTSYVKNIGSAGQNKRFTQLAVEVKSRGSSSRGRGRPRGAASKRKLFVSEFDGPMDILE